MLKVRGSFSLGAVGAFLKVLKWFITSTFFPIGPHSYLLINTLFTR